jgi:hypothetical protein
LIGIFFIVRALKRPAVPLVDVRKGKK